MSQVEKTMNDLDAMDLGEVDWLVEQGFYSSRSDFVRTAIHSQLEDHAPAPKQKVARRELMVGINGNSGKGLVFKFSTIYTD